MGIEVFASHFEEFFTASQRAASYPPIVPQTGPGIKKKLCNYHEAGNPCPRGETCFFAHGPEQIGMPIVEKPPGRGGFKTKLCTFFEVGNCPRGSSCTYAHGPHEIGQGSGGQIKINHITG